jgi:dephospho-CoA kinase
MIKIGITGGIGSGKSVVATLLQLFGIPVYTADDESKRLTNESPIIRKGLISLFGNEIYMGEALNKPLLASKIFQNAEMLQRVNGIIHPEVKRDFFEWAERQHTKACAIESAILFESGFDKTVDTTLMVYAPEEIRIQRALQRDNSTREAIVNRIHSQLPDEVKRDRCDYVIYNDDRQPLIPQVAEFVQYINVRK